MLEPGQIWEEKESGDARKIISVDQNCDLLTYTFPYSRRRNFRECRIRTFEAWVRRTHAELYNAA